MEGDTEIRAFTQGDDAAYEDHIRQHGGYVLVERKADFMLHEASCGHLDLTPGKFTLTARPRRWAKTRQPLIDWATQRTGSRPAFCQSCL